MSRCWIAGFLVLIFFFHGCNAEDRCKNVQNDTQIAAAVKSRLQTFQEFLFTRNESTVCDVTENHYNAVYCIAFAAFVLLGVIFTFFGYRLFKLILFLTGFIAVFLFVFYFSYNNIPCSWNLKYIDYISLGIAAAAGLIVGILAVCFFYFGIALIGFALGCVAGLAFLSFVHIGYVEDHSWLPVVIIVVLGVIGAIIALLIQKPLIILSTSLVGGYLIVMGLDYFVENMQAFIYAWNLMDHHAKASFPHCTVTWVMLSLVPIFAIFGIIIQGKCTGKGDHHKRSTEKKKPVMIEMDDPSDAKELLII